MRSAHAMISSAILLTLGVAVPISANQTPQDADKAPPDPSFWSASHAQVS
jgi:hypothetical protein